MTLTMTLTSHLTWTLTLTLTTTLTLTIFRLNYFTSRNRSLLVVRALLMLLALMQIALIKHNTFGEVRVREQLSVE